MRKLRTFLDRYSLEQNYISFIRPLMEYADVIWDNKKQNLINKLENIQLDAAVIVTGDDQINIT
jgi:uridine kinase